MSRTSKRILFIRYIGVLTGALLGAPALQAQDAAYAQYPFSFDGVYHEIETKYIFGFADGSDIGAEGETAIDVFYLTLDGQKLDSAMQEKLATDMQAALEQTRPSM